MMTTEEAQEYLSKLHSAENGDVNSDKAGQETALQADDSPAGNDANVAPNTGDGAVAGEDTDGDGETPSNATEEKASSQAGGRPDGDGHEKTDLEKNKERWASSFRKEKEKRKRLQTNYENQIKSLQKEIADLKAKQNSEGFDGKSDEGIQTLIDRKSAERELSRLEEQQAEMQMAEDLEENERRISACFPDEKDRQIYLQLVKNSGRDFADKLARYDEDNVILSGLDDCDISPIVVRVLMTRPDFLNEILSKRTRHGKEKAFDSLVNRLRFADKLIREKRATKQNGSQPKAERESGGLQNLKATGKQAKTSSGSDSVVTKDANYWNRYLEEHSR